MSEATMPCRLTNVAADNHFSDARFARNLLMCLQLN
jgi:hypothetical protein